MAKINEKEIKTFSQKNFATKLKVPEGTNYIDASSSEQIKEALSKGLAAHTQSCEGNTFLWQNRSKYCAEIYFLSSSQYQEFDSLDEAVDLVASCLE